jgi:hypothetical protein
MPEERPNQPDQGYGEGLDQVEEWLSIIESAIGEEAIDLSMLRNGTQEFDERECQRLAKHDTMPAARTNTLDVIGDHPEEYQAQLTTTDSPLSQHKIQATTVDISITTIMNLLSTPQAVEPGESILSFVLMTNKSNRS